MMMAPAVKKAEMIGFDSILHRNPSFSAPNTRKRIATKIVTCTLQHPQCPQQLIRLTETCTVHYVLCNSTEALDMIMLCLFRHHVSWACSKR